MAVEMTSRLEAVCGTLPKTLFFKYTTLGQLTDFFAGNHHESMRVSSILPRPNSRTRVRASPPERRAATREHGASAVLPSRPAPAAVVRVAHESARHRCQLP
jgi:hypothetical protein